jgi:hypothetical protein
MLLFAYPLADAMAWMVSVEKAVMGPLYPRAGGVPLIKYSMLAQGVASVIVAVCQVV